nr:DUF5131 family protein [Anaerolineae bacterium]
MPTKIEWTEEVWNVVTGCTKVSPGCANCYAEAMCRRFWRQWDRDPPPDHFKLKLHYATIPVSSALEKAPPGLCMFDVGPLPRGYRGTGRNLPAR